MNKTDKMTNVKALNYVKDNYELPDDISEKIDTYETSILPYEDCCTIFVAKHPVTKPKLEAIEKHEHNLDEKIDELVKQAIDSVEIVKVQ